MRRRRLVALVAAALVVLSAPLAANAIEPHAFPGSEGRIAFVDQGMDDAAVIATMDSDGTDVAALTSSADSPYGDYDPAWSPGGTMILFTRLNSSFAGEIWRIDADGTDAKRLTTNSADDSYANWSADGSRILFASNRAGNYEIYSMDTNGGSVTRLTSTSSDEFDPAWSPDNTRIAFVSMQRGHQELFLMSTTGTNRVRETDGVIPEQDHFAPDWSPDGTMLTYSVLDTGGGHVRWRDVATNADGVVGGGGSFEQWSAFSPDAALDRVVYGTNADSDEDDIAIDDLGAGAPEVLVRAGYQSQPDWQPIPDFPLVDARFSPFKAAIEYVYAQGLTVGCTPERYCPSDVVTRGQMATFLVRALGLPPATQDYFTDDETSSHEASINRIREAGITSGCGGTNYCPNAPVTREQMATFLTKGFALPTTTTDYFTDDETSQHEGSINRVAAAGITSGCGGTNYCPLNPVTREQMAAFLKRALE